MLISSMVLAPFPGSWVPSSMFSQGRLGWDAYVPVALWTNFNEGNIEGLLAHGNIHGMVCLTVLSLDMFFTLIVLQFVR